MRHFSKFILCVGLLSLPLTSANAAPIKNVIKPNLPALPEDSRVGLIFKQSGLAMQSHYPNQLFPPASTLKLFTALAAKLQLGDSFRFKTTMYQRGNDVVLHFTGDPSLTKQHLGQLLIDSKIKSIKGNLILDGRQFVGHDKPIGLPWDTMGACYAAPSTAITLDRNCLYASVYTNKDGSTRAFAPEYQPVTLSSTAKTVTYKEQSEQFCTLDLVSNYDNSYEISGCAVQRSKPIPLKLAIQDTALYTSAILKQTLANQNITIGGTVKQISPSAPQQGANDKVLATHYSAYLPRMLTHMLRYSDNLYANNITKTLGSSLFAHPGSYRNGTQAIKNILQDKAGVDIQSSILEDGAGLSRNNRVSAMHLYSTLRFIINNDRKINFVALMPTSGTTGTLRNRRSMQDAEIKGKIKAKSGSVFATYNMAGFILGPDGRPDAIFVELITDYHAKSNGKPSPLQVFEGGFYKDMIQQLNPPK